MNKALFTLVLILSVSASSLAWCESRSFQIGATIPFHTSIKTPEQTIGKRGEQLGQIDQLVRNNQLLAVKSYVTL